MKEGIKGWLELYTKYEVAAICCVTHATVVGWFNKNTLPPHSAKLLELYTGNITMAAWEDEVTATAKEMHEKEKARK